MSSVISVPPFSPREPVTDVLHGIPVTDPYRWLEDSESPETRRWLERQTEYARAYLDHIPGRDVIRERIREFLDVEAYDSVRKVGSRYFFRKRLPRQEQPCVYLREGIQGKDELLIDPLDRGTGKYTAVKPLRVSPDGRFLLYEIRQGGERSGVFEILDLENRRLLPDALPRGYLRGFSFGPDGKSFYYVHEPVGCNRACAPVAYRHRLGSPFSQDAAVFSARGAANTRLHLISDSRRLGFLVSMPAGTCRTSFYVQPYDSASRSTVVAGAEYGFGPMLAHGRILAITDRDAPNYRIVEVRLENEGEPTWIDVVPESDAQIRQWVVVRDRIFVSYVRGTRTEVFIFNRAGKKTGEIHAREDETIRLAPGSLESDELLFERESFTRPASVFRYADRSGKAELWTRKTSPLVSTDYGHMKTWYVSKDGTEIPITLAGSRKVLEAPGPRPTIMTSYGGYGVSMTPQFSVFAAFLMERGCLFALPNIRGGSEFGAAWHEAAKGRDRQTGFDDFLCAAEWLIRTGRTTPERLAIFGGSNSGLLVGAALTQRPGLFGAVVCMVPLLDMLRYHLFDNAQASRNEFGTAEDPEDFACLARYSPYHQVREGTAYPATLIVSGDQDRNCNPLHARKMTARLQQANTSGRPVILDYSRFRGHSPVLPLTDRMEALTDRMAFLCDQLQLPIGSR